MIIYLSFCFVLTRARGQGKLNTVIPSVPRIPCKQNQKTVVGSDRFYFSSVSESCIIKSMKRQPFEPKQDGQDLDRFLALAKQVISVPKKEIDRRIEEERRQKELPKQKRKA